MAVRFTGVDVGSVGVDFDDVAVSPRGVRIDRGVEAVRVDPFPTAERGPRGNAVARAWSAATSAGHGRVVAVGEVLVEVLLGGEDRAPRRVATGAVVEHAENGGARRRPSPPGPARVIGVLAVMRRFSVRRSRARSRGAALLSLMMLPPWAASSASVHTVSCGSERRREASCLRTPSPGSQGTCPRPTCTRG